MKNNKGFTLVELLAVIAILAILVIIALPNVLKMFNESKEKIFLTESKSVFKEAINQTIKDRNLSDVIYCKRMNDEVNPLNMSGRNIYYYIKTNVNDKTGTIIVWDNERYVKYKGDKLDPSVLDNAEKITDDIKNATCDNILEASGLVKKIDYSKVKFELGDTVRRVLTMKLDTSNQDLGEVKYKIIIRSINKIIELSSVDYTNKYYLEFNDFTSMEAYSGFEVSVIINGKEFDKKTIGPACFVKGTKVKTEDGFKNIEDIKIGDKVYSYNLNANRLELKEVTDAIISQTIETYLVTIDKKTFEVTPRHELYIIDKGWVRAYDLKVNDKMLDSNGKEIIVTKIEHKKYDKPIKTYNLSVHGNHNYFVTDIQVLVHNKGSDTWTYY